MARFFEEEAKHAIVGKRILELASGTGILGLHLGLMGAKHVVMTDKESMKELLQGNIQRTKLKEVGVPAGRKDGGSVGMWKPS